MIYREKNLKKLIGNMYYYSMGIKEEFFCVIKYNNLLDFKEEIMNYIL